MPKNHLFKPPEHLVKQWPEVFEGLYMNTMPIAYINRIGIIFHDGRIWEIDVADKLLAEDPEIVANSLLDIFEEYHTEIEDLSFDIDVDRLKQDINNKTKNLF
jgi:hypothetical protein